MNFTLVGSAIWCNINSDTVYFFQWQDSGRYYCRCRIDQDTYNKLRDDVYIEGVFKGKNKEYTLSFDPKYHKNTSGSTITVPIEYEDFQNAMRDAQSFL